MHATVSVTPSDAVPAGSRVRRSAACFAPVIGAWVLVVATASAVPDDHPLARAALFLHLVSVAVGFGAVVMVDVYGLLWLRGDRTLEDVVSLAGAAHGVISVAVGGLLASGIALSPDLGTTLTRLKLGLVLVLMLNGVGSRMMLRRFGRTVPSEARGASIPWAALQRMLMAAAVSQSTWWGAIAIGFLTDASRRG